jgi:thioredoxin-like negative regulator of GroEL
MSKDIPENPAATEKQTVKEMAEKDYEAEVLKSELPVVLDFYSANSAPCTALAPRFGAVAEKFQGKARFLRVSSANSPGLCQKLGVTASPTLVFFKSGKEFGDRLTGDDIKRTALKGLVEALLK